MARNILVAFFAVAGLVSGSAFAGGNDNHGGESFAGQAGVGGQLTVFGGSVSGTTGVISSGNATTAAAGSGNFASNQSAGGSTVGQASVGGAVTAGGTNVFGTTSQATNSWANGSSWGTQDTNAQGQFLNGGTSFDTTSQAAAATGAFQAATVGAEVGVSAFQATQFDH